MSNDFREYRKYLSDAEQKISESYIKTIVALSSGALGVSFAFIKDVLGTKEPVWTPVLMTAWIFLTGSLASIVFYLVFARYAFLKAIKQVDAGTINDESPGGWQGKITDIIHIIGAALLIGGLLLIGVFLAKNL